ncbi:hypothetical protein N0V83_002028 [Neocucurbitaria cava]|uniref:Major facilitator superfamily (MFS) profile domain-containing protein n=1 Tax=Neocucurbitaria cava TaxID=798079 RepID=A0A9W9CQJ3_9PLEO|nr:hypothetical protein N0V83_002028 [Neocucurbitaria cava]
MPVSHIANNTNPQWWKDPGMRKLNILLLSCYLGAMANGYVSALISSLITNPRWFEDLKGLSSVKLLGLVVAAQPLGCIAAFFPAPWLSDRFGRRAGVMFGNVGMTGAFIGQIFCRTPHQFLAMRLIAGFASIFNTISSSALLLELAHPRQRAIAGALFNTVLATFHANGRIDDQLVLHELSKICASAESENQRRDVGWLALCDTPGNRKRLMLSVAIGVATQFVGNGIITYYLAPVLQTVGITSALKQQGINGGLQIYNWFLACGAALMAERAGRRRLFLTSAATMLVFMILVTICSAFYSTTQSMVAGYAVIVFLFLFLGGYVIGLTPIPILYINEIWPSHLRAKGTSVFWVSQAVATCFNQYVNPIALQRIMWKYYLVYVGVLVAVIVFMFFQVPETKGLSLEEISGIFDRQHVDAIVLPVIASREDDASNPDEA